MNEQIEKVFRNLDRWRHLPNYQLERRSDIFFSIYLKALVEELEGQALSDVIIPELPIKTDGSGRSFKVDFVLFTLDRRIAYFVELKTDCDSRRDDQDAYLQRAVDGGFEKVLNDLKEITSRTTSYQKYWHLLHWLAKAGVVMVSDDVRKYLYPKVLPGLRAGFASVEVVAKDIEIRVIYVQPHQWDLPVSGAGERCISFDFIIRHLDKYDDEFSKLFAKHLHRWKERSGEEEPGTLL